jgi:hypothetical protein
MKQKCQSFSREYSIKYEAIKGECKCKILRVYQNVLSTSSGISFRSIFQPKIPRGRT